MGGTGRFIINFFPLFLLGGVFGKLMDDSGAALSIAHDMTKRLGETRAVLAVVLACAVLTYGGVSLFAVALPCSRWRPRCSGRRSFHIG